jgi:hypothetical protein
MKTEACGRSGLIYKPIAGKLLRKNSTYCGSRRWGGGVTCDARMDYMMSKYRASPEEAFLQSWSKLSAKTKVQTYAK